MLKSAPQQMASQPAVTTFQCTARLSSYPVSHHAPSNSASVAAGFVSSLAKGAAHAGRCVWLAVARAVLCFLHECSVVEHSLTGNGVFFQKGDTWN